MEQVAKAVSERLREQIGEANMVGVSYYTAEGVGHVYRSEWAETKYDPAQVDQIVDDLRLEAIGHLALEQRQEQSLHATVRIYDNMLDAAIPVKETEGVAFALTKDGDYSTRDAVAVAEQAIEDAPVERSVLA